MIHVSLLWLRSLFIIAKKIFPKRVIRLDKGMLHGDHFFEAGVRSQLRRLPAKEQRDQAGQEQERLAHIQQQFAEPDADTRIFGHHVETIDLFAHRASPVGPA